MATKALLGFDHYPQNDTTWISKAPSYITRLEVGNANFRDGVVNGWVRTLSSGSADTYNRVQFNLASFFAAPVDKISFGIRLRCDVPPSANNRVLMTPWTGLDLTSNEFTGAIPVAGKTVYVEFIYTFSTDRYEWWVDGQLLRSGVTGTPTRNLTIGQRTSNYQSAERWAFKDVVITDDQGGQVFPLGPRNLVLTDAATGTYRADVAPTPLSLRTVRGYAMATTPAQVGVRQVMGYAMASAPSPLPQGVTGKQAVLNMIVARSKASRPTTDVSIDLPQVLTGDESFNSKVKATAQAASGLLGNMTFRYNRVPLRRMNIVSTAFDLGTATTVYGLIPALNTASGMILTTDDLEDGPIASTDMTVTLKAKAGSYWFLPGDTLAVGKTLTSINIPISSDTIDW